MADEPFVIIIDTPSIKKYVFGSDPLNEVRGASARLDRLNRIEMEKCLTKHPDIRDVDTVYANGGSAQFLVKSEDATKVKGACKSMARHIREQTGGEVGIAYGVASLTDETSYHEAVRVAHFQLRCQREFATCHRSASLVPIIRECGSASHLPAAHIMNEGNSQNLLSQASYEKVLEGRDTRYQGLWGGWMQYLTTDTGEWPDSQYWGKLRCESLTDIGDRSGWHNYIGIVYADGNAMGQIVQAMTQPETFRQFSKIVDESIQEACFAVLSEIFESEINKVRGVYKQQRGFERLAADILLLGGDDLLVALPADRALDFALKVTEKFESRTKDRIDALQEAATKQFFHKSLGERGFTISCGVAIVKSSYPFYLALDLAEQLLKNAKRQNTRISKSETQNVARVDFHVVAGANSYALGQVREDDYLIDSDAHRTLRPLSCPELETLRKSVQMLQKVKFPHGKLYELQKAALSTRWIQASLRIQSIFARCQHGKDRSQRRALWDAVRRLCPHGYNFNFPWFEKDGQRLLCVADLVEAYRLFIQ